MSASMIQPGPMPEKLSRNSDRPRLKRTRLKQVSEKRQAENIEYRKAKAVWWAARREIDGGRCQFIHVVRCGLTASPSPHHIYGRGKYLCESGTFLACCEFHHRWIHDNPKEAEARGYLVREWRNSGGKVS